MDGLSTQLLGIGNQLVDVCCAGHRPVTSPQLLGSIIYRFSNILRHDAPFVIYICVNTVGVLLEEFSPCQSLAEFVDDGGNLGGVHIGVGHTITALHTEVDRTPFHSRRKTEIYGTTLIHTIGIDDGMTTVFHLNIRAVVGKFLDAGIFVANGVFAVY